MDDVLDEWSTSVLKFQIDGAQNPSILKKMVCFFFPSSCFCLKQVALRHDIAHRIKEINEEVDAVAKQKDICNFSIINRVKEEQPQKIKTTSFVNETEIHGRGEENDILLSKLLCESSQEPKVLPIISLVGMGGIGKTTLAQLVYNNEEVINNFEKRIWVCVSDPFDEIKVAKAISEALKNDASNLSELQSILECISKSIVRMKFLLVLDDVWTEDYNKWGPLYNCLKNSLHGSKILVTTRKETVARIMKSSEFFTTRELSEEACWLLFRQIAFSERTPEDREALEEIGRKIISKCKGLPLAAKTIGGLLRFKETREEWQNILDSEMWKLEDVEKGLFPPLLLSYNDLPPMIKSCFIYCAIFPKDSNLDKNELIHLWMAQDYLKSEQNTEMEIIGKECFDNLVARSLLQEVKKDDDDDGSDMKWKMHDIVHDVALFLSRNEYLLIEDSHFQEPSINFSCDKTRHLTVKSKMVNKIPFPISIPILKKLRSLLIISDGYHSNTLEIKEYLPKFFDQLICLRALDLSGIGIKEIPREIGKLVHLRFLDFSNNGNVEKLPETLCELYNLQTLKVEMCENLKMFPQGIGKLVKLRHIIFGETFGISYMPKGIERLTCLRTLTQFVVNSSDHNREAGALECLKNLNQLRGYLYIKGFGNVKDESEVKKAEFWKKKNLSYLDLDFEGMAWNDEKPLKALQPPPNLERLAMSGYCGKIVSSNTMRSFSTLKHLYIRFCRDWECLPPLGKWPFLESLHVSSMNSIKKVSNEFLGVESAGAPSSSNVIFFPKLKSLEFEFMFQWEEWDYGIASKDLGDITIMPCLHTLKFQFCEALKVLPEDLFQRTTLEVLEIIGSNPTLEELHKKWKHERASIRSSTSK